MDQFATLLMAPFVAVIATETMFYWPYLVSAGVLAFAVPAVAERSAALQTIREQFSARIWWSPSARADYRFYVVNAILFPVIVAPAILTSYEVAQWVSAQLQALAGARTEPMMGETAIRVAYTVVFFLAYDFGRFLAHWAQHRVPLLWQFHKVHHSAETLNPVTSARFHPVDLFVMAVGGNAFGGLATGVFLYLGAGHVSAYLFLGLHVGIAVYNLVGILRHTHVWLDYGPLDYLFISPAQHQIHHSLLMKHRDKNCGFALAIWDWLFGTLYVPKAKETFPMGLGDGTDGQWHRVIRFYWWPVKMAGRLLAGRHPVPARAPGTEAAE